MTPEERAALIRKYLRDILDVQRLTFDARSRLGRLPKPRKNHSTERVLH